MVYSAVSVEMVVVYSAVSVERAVVYSTVSVARRWSKKTVPDAGRWSIVQYLLQGSGVKNGTRCRMLVYSTIPDARRLSIVRYLLLGVGRFYVIINIYYLGICPIFRKITSNKVYITQNLFTFLQFLFSFF